MTDIKKTTKRKETAKSKKLGLNKETLKELSASKLGEVKGGARCSNSGGYLSCQCG